MQFALALAREARARSEALMQALLEALLETLMQILMQARMQRPTRAQPASNQRDHQRRNRRVHAEDRTGDASRVRIVRSNGRCGGDATDDQKGQDGGAN
jgi:hypothetical protein